jgi:hypothetical protein
VLFYSAKSERKGSGTLRVIQQTLGLPRVNPYHQL